MPRKSFFRSHGYKTSKIRRNKFGVRIDDQGKTERTVEGALCDSKGEANRYRELILLQKAGEIRNLKYHELKLEIEVQGKHIANYTPDFCYVDSKTNEIIVEDFKGAETRDFKLIWKLVEALYGTKYKFIKTTSRSNKNRKYKRRS